MYTVQTGEILAFLKMTFIILNVSPDALQSKSSQDTWRNHYQKTANTVVAEALSISRKKGGDAAVKAHVKRALGPCGEAFWEKPHPTVSDSPHFLTCTDGVLI